MCPCNWRMLQPLLIVAAVSCCAWLMWQHRDQWFPKQDEGTPEPELERLYPDVALRTLPACGRSRETYRLPEGEDHGMIALLWFEDGKFRGRRAQWQMAGRDGTRVVAYEILWGQDTDGETQLLGVIRSTRSLLHGRNTPSRRSFLAKLDGEIFADSPPTEQFRGYQILGLIVSEKARAGMPTRGGAFEFERALKNRETVAVIGARTFPTRKQLGDWMMQCEPGDP